MISTITVYYPISKASLNASSLAGRCAAVSPPLHSQVGTCHVTVNAAVSMHANRSFSYSYNAIRVCMYVYSCAYNDLLFLTWQLGCQLGFCLYINVHKRLWYQIFVVPTVALLITTFSSFTTNGVEVTVLECSEMR